MAGKKQKNKKNKKKKRIQVKSKPHSTGRQYSPPEGFHLMAKPIGPVCNLRCKYCFYTEKESLFPDEENYRMSDEVLEAYIRKYIETQKIQEVPFVWQGGEPTLMGLDFFKKVVSLQNKYKQGKRITNSLQTNGTLLNDEWCKFLAQYRFLVGLSLDGPEDIHNRYRVDRGGKPTFQSVMDGLKLMQNRRVDFNVLACVTRESSKRPLDVYRFLKEQGVKYIQFIPIVERKPDSIAGKLGLRLGLPPSLKKEEADKSVMPWTVQPEAYGDFLNQIFDEWVKKDVGNIFVMNFEWAIANWAGVQSTACSFSRRCGRSVIVEHNGDIYSCDHFVYPEYRLGNIMEDSPRHLIDSMKQIGFGAMKETTLPDYCRNCEFLIACRGECPKHRFMTTPAGKPGLNYLCPGFRKFFGHIAPYAMYIIRLLQNGLPATAIMKAIDSGKIK